MGQQVTSKAKTEKSDQFLPSLLVTCFGPRYCPVIELILKAIAVWRRCQKSRDCSSGHWATDGPEVQVSQVNHGSSARGLSAASI